MKYFDIELVDIDPNTENYSFSKVSEERVKHISDRIMQDCNVTFDSLECTVAFHMATIKAVYYTPHVPPKKTAYQETMEEAVEVKKTDFKNPKAKVTVSKTKVFKEA